MAAPNPSGAFYTIPGMGTVADATVNELVNEAMKRIADFRGNAADGATARDYSLAITHLEDGLTRFNSAQYRQAGTWNRRDPERG